jgi:ribonuclease E
VVTDSAVTTEIKPIREGREARNERGEQRRARQPKLEQLSGAQALSAAEQVPLVLDLTAPGSSETVERQARGERGGRNRRGGRGRNERTERSEPSEIVEEIANSPTQQTLNSSHIPPIAKVSEHVPAVEVQQVITAVPAAAPLLPVITTPMDEAPLRNLSKTVGLEWVNTDTAAFAAAQAKILNQPKPVRVPRERPRPASVDVEPLQLMETRKPV